ncbi:MAG: hypothetical protein KFF77_00515 [Bacteroidetes bacterium]|nr:hypothetical protein [Bacteroidota bacterium]
MQKLREDERLVAIRHRAGYAAFMTVFTILIILLAMGMFIDMGQFFFPPAILLLPAFAGALVFVIQLRRGGYSSSMQEEIHRRPTLLRKQQIRLVLGGAAFSILMFLGYRYTPFLSGRNAHEGGVFSDAIFSICMGITWTAVMWYLNHRRNASKAEDTGDGED